MKDIKLIVFDNPIDKRKGLLGKEYIKLNEVYLFPKTNNITSKGMKFTIKVIFLNQLGEVLESRILVPNKQIINESAYATLEVSPFFNINNLNELKQKIVKAL